jgi:hypothetical protein
MITDAQLLDNLQNHLKCSRCECSSCERGYENHEHICTKGDTCIENVKDLKKRISKMRFDVSKAIIRIKTLTIHLKSKE